MTARVYVYLPEGTSLPGHYQKDSTLECHGFMASKSSSNLQDGAGPRNADPTALDLASSLRPGKKNARDIWKIYGKSMENLWKIYGPMVPDICTCG